MAAVHHKSAGNVYWLLFADVIAIACAGLLVLSWFAGPGRSLTAELSGWNHWFIYASAASMLCYYAACGRYTSRATSRAEVRVVLIGCLGAFGLSLMLSGFSDRFTARFLWESVVVWFSIAVFLRVVRETARSILLRLGRWRLRTLVVGPESLRARVSDALHSDRSLGVEIVHWIEPSAGTELEGRRALQEHLRRADVDFVLLAGNGDAAIAQKEILRDLVQFRMPFGAIQAEASNRRFAGRRYALGQGLSLELGLTRLDQAIRLRIKRACEILLALVLLSGLLPLFLIFAFVIRMDGGPTFYGQVRVGRGGRPFRCLKFRSMVHNADKVLADLLARDPEAAREWACDFKLKDDPRITKLGRFLRSSSLDELPQLLNVLRGEMSFVGPRPIVEAEIERYREDIDLYYLVRPGITGLWQISGRNDVTYDERVAFDARYVLNWSLKFDLLIMLKTLPAVLRKSGAY
ncbi:MAG TPA: exopolysaccharide biosynthesis polyprenyl glycosylphosphotransferase [Aliidongia sp.]|uniref:exopolysaccharide biosynthesis polyprenyl glycosylphosphotransferase n=1 Tax=Aliidongia sp. TaxID=1914230 RepID=UPI002DDCA52A|nr:exopolysaccharide biosynthesis polyprenyl glycosylphosphotransferase [Aliidongia sp.]HEV2674589.1 exopolysaccharide biosynthesis polyprenyl glycosylphosphotransferase [Aliidongia sp.]